MPGETREFIQTRAPDPHAARTKAILHAHPEVRQLIGSNPWSSAIIAAVLGLQLGATWLLASQPWWVLIAAAWLFGAFCNHAMYVMIHEAAHGLIFRRRIFNDLAAVVGDIINVVPAAISFRTYHLKHHAHQGVYDLDADLPSRWEARLIGHSRVGKALWMLLFPLFEMLRPLRLRAIRVPSIWLIADIAAVILANAAILTLMGPKALAYLAFSFAFAVGFHPVGARWIQEHYIVADGQETYSYYGPLNLVAFNIGYHNEHHDFPSIPWNRLPRLKALAPEFYDPLVSHKSWFRLWWRFILDPALSHFSRVVRT